MIRDILLVGEDVIKSNTSLNDNLWGSYLLPSIQYAQENGLCSIIGECLFDKICELVSSNTIGSIENVAYKDLLDKYIQPYLINKTICELIPTINVKIANVGTVLTNDEHISNISQKDMELLRNSYSERSDFYAKRMQEFLKNNENVFPELNCGCGNMKPNLESSVNSVGIYLGGFRGKKISSNNCGCENK